MPSTEEQTTTCGQCGTVNHLILLYAGDWRANERESAACVQCGAEVLREKCAVIVVGRTADEAKANLRKAQNRA